MKSRLTTTSLASALALLIAAALGACDDRAATDRAMGRQLDEAFTQSRQAADDPNPSRKQSASDATITASVHARLAKEPDLGAAKIGVDTHEGHVVLTGNAPNNDAKARATQVASAVDGVVAVDNRMVVQMM